MQKLELISNILSYEERIQSRVDRFKAEILEQDGSMEYVEDILIAVQNYLCEYTDPDLQQAAIKIRESIFYVDAWSVD